MHIDQPIRYSVSVGIIQDAMRLQGFKTIQQLADHLGVHRNTLGAYFSGVRALPEALEKMLVVLNLSPAQVFERKRIERQVPAIRIKDLIEKLSSAMPDAAFVLFGSRARGKAKQYSDYDIGVFKQQGLPLTQYSRLLDLVETWNEIELTHAQLINLSNADNQFLEEISGDLIFLAGSFGAWCNLIEKSNVVIHEGSKTH